MSRIGTFDFVAPLWLHSGSGAWHFVSLPPEVSEDVADLTVALRKGFGSVRVEVTVGGTSWRTSVFPDATTETYVLPVKKTVRVAERLAVGDAVRVRIELTDL
jgi:hypothetical protein